MSEKRVNINITASTSDFDKAIKKAQNQIEKLAETIENIGSGKFGNQLEKQIEKVADASKKAQDELEEIKDNVDDINKSKVNKTKKEFDKMADSVEDANDELKDTKDNLDDLNKAKVNKLEKQFEDTKKVVDTLDDKLENVINSLKDMDGIDIDDITKSFENIKDANEELKKRLEDLAKEFDDLDSQDLNRLEGEFDQIETSIRNMRDEIRDATDNLDRQFQDSIDGVKDFDNAIEDIDYDNINEIKDDLKDLNKFMDKSLGDMGNKKLNIDANIDAKSGKGSGVLTELLGAEMIGSRVSSAVQEVKEGLDKAIDSMKDFNNLTPQEQVKVFDDLANEMIKAQNEMEKLKKEYSDKSAERSGIEESMKNLQEESDKAQKEIDELIDKQKELENSYDDLNKSSEKHKAALLDAEKAMESYNKKWEDWNKADKRQNEISEELGNINELIGNKLITRLENLTENFTDVKDEAEKAAKAVRDMFDYDGDELSQEDWMKYLRKTLDESYSVNFLQDVKKDNPEAFSAMRNTLGEIEEGLDRVRTLWKEFDDLDIQKMQLGFGMEGYEEAEKKYKELSSGDAAKKHEEEEKALKNLEQELDDNIKKQKELADTKEQAKQKAKSLNDELEKQRSTYDSLEADMQALQESMDKGNKKFEEQADKVNEQLQAYEKHSKKVKEYISNEEKSLLLREKVAKSFKATADAMEQPVSSSSKHNNADLVAKTLKEAAEYVKKINVVDTKYLQNDLNRLGEILEDKTDKVKRFKAICEEFGSKDAGLAYWLEEESKVLKDYANGIPVVVEAMNTLKKAWGDVSIGGEDNLKLRAREELLDDFVDNLKKKIIKIRNAYSELESLDDIYEKATDEEKVTIDDWKAWEKNKEALQEYNKAITEYMSTIKDMGGQVDDKFLDNFGKFDFDKFVEDFDKMGASTVVLSKRLNAVKSALLEGIKVEKEESKASVDNAKANQQQAQEQLEAAKANQKAAQEAADHSKQLMMMADKTEEASEATKKYYEDCDKLAKATKEVEEAQEKLQKSEEALTEAKQKAKNIDEDRIKNAEKLIKSYNEQAEAARKLGIAIEDISKADIASFDKSLASLLDANGAFGSDLPGTLGDLKEDIKAIFADMEVFDLGSALGGLKDVGLSVLSKIPLELQAAVGAALAIGAALKKSAEMGVEHFSKGVGTIKGAFSGIVNIARNVGQELRDAFENITGMQMDASSLMELPIEFESQMAKVGAITETFGTDAFKELEEEARKWGATTRYSATEAAQAMEYMGMAGWDNQQIMAGIEGVLNLATVAGMDLGEASDFVTDALTALGMKAEQSGEMVDMLATISTKTNTSVEQMQKAFSNVAPVAGSFGMNMKDLSMALGLMANQGVKGAKAGTALKNMISNLNRPTEEQLAVMKKYNLLGARKAMIDGDLMGGINQMKQALSGLSNSERNQVIELLAGQEALSGISALLGSTTEDINELDEAMKNCEGSAAEMAKQFDDTVKGALLGLASAMQETLLQVFDKTEEGIKKTVKQLTGFFSILNGMGQPEGYESFSGLADALVYLEEISQGWGQAIANGLTNAIGAINDFVNSASFDNLLQVGTNIIDGIAEGIKNADGLGSAISTAIGKLATWFSDNLETVVEVGRKIIDAISNGISENGDAIGECIKQVMEMQTEIDKAIAKEKWKLIGENLVTFITGGIESKFSVFVAALEGFFSGGIGEAFLGLGDNLGEIIENAATVMFSPVKALGEFIGNLLRDAIVNAFNLDGLDLDVDGWIKDKLFGGGKDSKSSKTSSKKKSSTSSSSNSISKSPIDTINKNLSTGKAKTDKTAASIGQGISDNITKKLETMDAAGLKELEVEMKSLQTTVNALATGMASSFKTIQDASRTSFMGLTNIVRNQMVNCTNIVRNQAINWYNIINNQTTNARNIFTQKFMSMASVARTQMVNVTNIIRNQALSWNNIIANQAKNARDNFTRQMISMAKVASTQMGKVSSSIRGAMNGVSGSTNFSINRTVSTDYVGGASALSANALYAANNASTRSIGDNTGALAYGASYAMSTGGGNSSNNSGGIGNNVTLEIPVMLDGRELARASARYVDNELKLMTKRENRKRGAK